MPAKSDLTTDQHPMLPTNQQIAEWESEYFDGERQNFDVMMIEAFQTGADCQLEQVKEAVSAEIADLRQYPYWKDDADTLAFHFDIILKTLRPQENNNV